jgi:hypothetical protein
MRKKYCFIIGLISLVFLNAALSVPGQVTKQTGAQIEKNSDEPTDIASENHQKYPPGIMFSNILNNVTLLHRDGRFNLRNQMQNVFMPEGAKGKVVLLKQGGNEICHWLWDLDTFGSKPPYKLFSFKQPLKPDGSNLMITQLKLTEPGEYVLDFYLEEKKFYTFPFTVKILEPANPFDGNKIYVTDGAWNNWGYLYYRDADPEQNLVWKIWMRESEYNQKNHNVQVTVTRDQDKKLICQSLENMTQRFQHTWVRYDFDLINPPVKTSGGAYFKAKDLLAVDGPYTLRMMVDGKPYGVWKFNINSGKLNYTGRTVRDKADPMTFIEGGKDAWWYQKQGS